MRAENRNAVYVGVNFVKTFWSEELKGKEWLINFYCAAGYRIAQKSEEHIRLIKKLTLASE